MLFRSDNEIEFNNEILEWWREMMQFSRDLNSENKTKTGIAGEIKSFNYELKRLQKLGIKKIKCIITQIGKEDTFLKGKILKTDKEIKDLFYLPEEVTVRRTKGGWVDQVNATKFITIRNKYEI